MPEASPPCAGFRMHPSCVVKTQVDAAGRVESPPLLPRSRYLAQ